MEWVLEHIGTVRIESTCTSGLQIKKSYSPTAPPSPEVAVRESHAKITKFTTILSSPTDLLKHRHNMIEWGMPPAVAEYRQQQLFPERYNQLSRLIELAQPTQVLSRNRQ